MAYIGKQPTTGDFVLLDSITTSATASYTMQKNSVNFEPQSANHMIVSLNGTIQAPVSSFTVSGSTLTFASALTSSDAIDFILVLGNVNDVGVASSVVDSAITKNKLNLISDSSSAGLTVKGDGSSENGTIQMNCSQNSHGIKLSSPAHSAGQSYELIFPTGNVTADKVLKVASVSGSGATGIGQLSFGDAGGSNTPYFHVYKSADQTISNSSFTTVTFDTEQYDSGSAFASNTFTAPSSGYYFIYSQLVWSGTTNSDYSLNRLMKNGSPVNWNAFFQTYSSGGFGGRILSLSASDTVLVQCYQNSGGNLDLRGGSEDECQFGGFKLIT